MASIIRYILVALAIFCTFGFFQPATAQFIRRPVVVAPRPVFVPRRPVVVAPRPVFVPRRPVVVAPRPVVVAPRPVGGFGRRF